jgi:hypothetical protein
MGPSQAVTVTMHDGDRGAVAEGAVGTRGAGRSKFFRYEVHCWRGGSIADIAHTVASPTRPTSDEATCRRLLTLLRSVLAGGGIRPGRWSAAMPGGIGTRGSPPKRLAAVGVSAG